MRSKDFAIYPRGESADRWGQNHLYKQGPHNSVKLSNRGSYHNKDMRDAWYRYIGDVLMMDEMWPEEMNVFMEYATLMTNNGDRPSDKMTRNMISCLSKYGFVTQLGPDRIIQVSIDKEYWITNNKTDLLDDKSRQILNALIETADDG
jgi:hypothetical protein